MSEVRSLLVEHVALSLAALCECGRPSASDEDWDLYPAEGEGEHLCWDAVCDTTDAAVVNERRADATVAAVLDAMSEGPLHEQMVEAGAGALPRPLDTTVSGQMVRLKIVGRVLSAALGAARMEGEK